MRVRPEGARVAAEKLRRNPGNSPYMSFLRDFCAKSAVFCKNMCLKMCKKRAKIGKISCGVGGVVLYMRNLWNFVRFLHKIVARPSEARLCVRFDAENAENRGDSSLYEVFG